MAEDGIYNRLLDFMGELDRHGVYYTLGHSIPDELMIAMELPGSKWEVEFKRDGEI